MYRWIGLFVVTFVIFVAPAKSEGRKTRWNQSVASWYGPGLWGNPLGCAGYGRLHRGTLGVAHKTLRCGTRVRICFRRCLTVRVIDRGPFSRGREFDLTGATKNAIGFPNGVAAIRWRIP